MMIRKMLSLTCAFALVGVGSTALAGDCKGCDNVAKTGHGFCHGKGKAYGVQLTSEKLFKSLDGKKFDATKLKCPGCKTAAKSDGKCEHCNVAMADGHAYRSSVAHTLAMGTPISAEKAAGCKGCKTAHGTDGFCDHCSVGFVAGRMYKAKVLFAAAKGAYEILAKAAEAAKECETCAVAMVTDGTCSSCGVKFKDGKKVAAGG